MEERLRRAALHLSEASNYGELVPGIVETLEDVTSLVPSSSVALVSEQLTSQDMVALLAAENGRICTAAIATITAMVLRLGGKLRAALAHDDGFLELLDELVYRLSTVNDTTCARSIVSLLMTMLESDEDVLDLFCHKYHGIRPVLKRWQSDGFDLLLRKFGDTVMSGDLQMAEAAYRRRAATVIQAVYRGHRQRRHLADATRTISQLQRRVRARRCRDARHRLELCRQEAATFCRTLHRQQWRRCHTEQLMQNVTGISAEKVPGYLRRRRSMAASRIQCAWRAYRVRGQVAGWREDRRRHRAAGAIQRWWRHCLLRASPDADQEPPLRLTEQDVDKYQRLIDRWDCLTD